MEIMKMAIAVAQLTAALVALVGFVAIIGYVTDMPIATSWTHTVERNGPVYVLKGVPMSIPTAVCMITISYCLEVLLSAVLHIMDGKNSP